MAKLTDATITEVSSLDDTALFYAVDQTRAEGDQDTRITKANLKTELAPDAPTLQEVTTQGATTTDAVTIQNELTVGDGAESIINTTDGSIEDDGGAMTIRHTSALTLNSPTLRKTNGEEIASFNGDWNASTNSPTLANTDANKKGVEYKVSTAGSVDFGAGSITFAIGDIVANDGSIWYKKVDNSQTFITNTYTFSTLPSGVIGMLATITDASSVSYRGTASGGGSDTALVFYDGTNWIYH